jgi:hypothetical protein
MNESIRFALEMDGEHLPIQAFGPAGLELENEIDAWPRSFVLEFDADNEVTRTRMNWVRDRLGWNPGIFNLNVTLDGGDLVVTGVDSRSFPGGRYWFSIQINSLKVAGGVQTIVFDDDEQVTSTLTVAEDPRRVVLKTSIDDWDRTIRDVLTNPGQTFDGLAIAEWLASPDPREARKACLLNLMAKLRVLPEDDNQPPFLTQVRRVFLDDVERIYAEIDRDMLLRLRQLAQLDSRPFYDEGPPTAAMHRRLLDRAGVPGHRLQSFRQDGRNSMQVVVAYPPGEPADGSYYADIDIDLGNPLRDLEGFVIHMGELLSGGDTDHLKLHDALARGATARFLYYDVRRS